MTEAQQLFDHLRAILSSPFISKCVPRLIQITYNLQVMVRIAELLPCFPRPSFSKRNTITSRVYLYHYQLVLPSHGSVRWDTWEYL